MDRCRDYFRFAVLFVGVGYIVLWPMTADGIGGALFGASIVCGDRPGRVVNWLCRLPHPLALPVGLHLLGLTAVLLLAVRLSCRCAGRLRRRATALPSAAPAARLPRVISLKVRSRPVRRPPTVKPREHFGLRGMPR